MPHRKRKAKDPAERAFRLGWDSALAHPLFRGFAGHVRFNRQQGNACPDAGWAVVFSSGDIHVHPRRRGDPDEWTWVVAHSLLHLGFEHFKRSGVEWNTACCCVATRFLADLKLGTAPQDVSVEGLPPTEDRLAQLFAAGGIPPGLAAVGTAGPCALDTRLDADMPRQRWRGPPPDWKRIFAEGIAASVASAVNVAGGREAYLGAEAASNSPAQRARGWLISSFPLLGSLAAAFRLVEDPALCRRLDVAVAMVDEGACEIYVNPAGLSGELECRFVIAHEFLHVGLRHAARRAGRDPFLWNVSCDFAVNAWLVEMGVGELPRGGVLYDPALKGLSAESIFDKIATDLRRFRRLRTLRGSDLDFGGAPGAAGDRDAMDLDEFYRRCLLQGLSYHEQAGRGTLPAGLIEEIRALGHPPISWEVRLARWFDHYFQPLERRRSFARPSRRQAAAPGIPLPRWIGSPQDLDARTFGVILDTSGSMDRALLARALGAVASYSMARDVPMVRVVFCDAAAYDAGYLAPEAISQGVKVRGRGGTVLQPGIDLLDRAADFPEDGPLLIITDGFCEPALRVRRDHAFLLPEGRSLPFAPKGPVFRMEQD